MAGRQRERARETEREREMNNAAVHSAAGVSAPSSHVDENKNCTDILLHLSWPPIRQLDVRQLNTSITARSRDVE